jgi:hypothetical protein
LPALQKTRDSGAVEKVNISLSHRFCIRRARLITCDYDITHEDVIEGRHFYDDVFVYGFHDVGPGPGIGYRRSPLCG